jgi:hypothetical protein
MDCGCRRFPIGVAARHTHTTPTATTSGTRATVTGVSLGELGLRDRRVPGIFTGDATTRPPGIRQ